MACILLPNGPGVERYTFYVHNGNASLKFDARTICVQGQSLS